MKLTENCAGLEYACVENNAKKTGYDTRQVLK